MDRSSDFCIIHLTDIHGAGNLIDKISKEITHADLVVLSGDITHFGHKKDAEEIFQEIRKYNSNLLIVPGNCDNEDIADYLANKENNIHLKNKKQFGHSFFGIGGSLPCPGRTPLEFTEEDIMRIIDQNLICDPEFPLIIIAHQPPYDTLNDRVSNGLHVGSHSLRTSIINYKPVLYLTGHIHEGTGIDEIDGCTIVNPGPFHDGRYALISKIGENPFKIEFKQITEKAG